MHQIDNTILDFSLMFRVMGIICILLAFYAFKSLKLKRDKNNPSEYPNIIANRITFTVITFTGIALIIISFVA